MSGHYLSEAPQKGTITRNLECNRGSAWPLLPLQTHQKNQSEDPYVYLPTAKYSHATKRITWDELGETKKPNKQQNQQHLAIFRRIKNHLLTDLKTVSKWGLEGHRPHTWFTLHELVCIYLGAAGDFPETWARKRQNAKGAQLLVAQWPWKTQKSTPD